MDKIIKRVIDNSYVIVKNGLPYHVPNEGEFVDEWEQVNAYAEAHPEEVTLEYPCEPTFEELVSAKRAEIWNTGDYILAQVKTRFTQSEIESWPKQEQGAKDIQAGNTETDDAKFVIAMAERRGIKTDVLVAKILNNVEYYGELSSKVIGEQQRLDDLIKLAEANNDKEALETIEWTYNPFEETIE